MKGHWQFERRFVEVEIWLDAIHRPMIGLFRVTADTSDGYHHNRAGLSLSWGDGNTDALWRIDTKVWLPHFIIERIPW